MTDIRAGNSLYSADPGVGRCFWYLPAGAGRLPSEIGPDSQAAGLA